MVSRDFFEVMGIVPETGRTLASDVSGERVVLSHRAWVRHCGSDPGIVGQSILLNGSPFVVLGVLPERFWGLEPGFRSDFYVSYSNQKKFLPAFPTTSPDAWWVQVMTRVNPGQEKPFHAALDVALARESGGRLLAGLHEGRRGLVPDRKSQRETLWMMLGATGLILLVACANLSGLSLARGAARRHEYAVRLAVGAARWNMIRMVLIESLGLSVVGSGLGFLLAFWIRGGLSRLLSGSPDGLAYDLSFNSQVLIVSAGLTLLTALISGLLPALAAARVDPLKGLQERAVLSASRLRTGKVLVACQLALTLMLLAGSGLFLKSMYRLLHIDPGFRTRNLLLVNADPGDTRGAPEVRAFHTKVMESLKELPGIQAAALSENALLSGNANCSSLRIPGLAEDPGQVFNADVLSVNESFFATMGIPVRQGRGFLAGDEETSTKVAVVSESFVRKYSPGRNVLGQLVEDAGSKWQIVGVCGDIRYDDLRSEAPAIIFFPFQQRSRGAGCYILRTEQSPLAYLPLVRRAIAAEDPSVPIFGVSTQEALRDIQLRQERMLAILCGVLAAFALFLACLGLYGLASYHTAQRMDEFGIRVALGAQVRDIRWLVLREILIITTCGLALGLGLAYGLSQLIQRLLYGVTPNDPYILFGVSSLLVLVAILSSTLPAIRASRMEPLKSMRRE